MKLKRHLTMTLLITAVLVMNVLPGWATNVIYVNNNANDIRNGKSWQTAFKSLFEALEDAGADAQIWVAQDTYYPNGDNDPKQSDRDATFKIPAGISVYGGFKGDETSLDQRDWMANPTILSGEIGSTSDNTDNSLHVVTLEGGILDGFHITGGYGAAGAGVDASGGTLRNNQIYGNKANGFGGGVSATGSAILTNNTIYNNEATYGGGVSASAAILTNNTIADNTALRLGGGILATGTTSVTNCTITDNTTLDSGGGVSATGSATVTNSTIYNNTAPKGGGVYIASSNTTLTNNILWGNANDNNLYVAFEDGDLLNITYNLIGGTPTFDGNHTLSSDNLTGDVNPFFVDAEDGDYNLLPGSPAIGAGLNGVDMGAYPYREPEATTYTYTLTLDLGAGIELYGISAGTHQIAEGDHLYLRFMPEDRTLTADDIMLVIDGVDTTFKDMGAGHYFSYILNPITEDHTILIAQREYPVTLPEGFNLFEGVYTVAYGEPFLFYTWAINEGTLKVYANGELLPCHIDQNPLRADQPEVDPSQLFYLVEKVVSPVVITTEGEAKQPTGNTNIPEDNVRVTVENGTLKVESTKPVDLSVYTTTGQLAAQRRIIGTDYIDLPAGIYIVQAAKQKWKIIINHKL